MTLRASTVETIAAHVKPGDRIFLSDGASIRIVASVRLSAQGKNVTITLRGGDRLFRRGITAVLLQKLESVE